MGQLHNPANPRHARLFELLRQHEVARGTTQRINVVNRTQTDASQAAQFQDTAQQSLKSREGHAVPPSPRRIIKLASHLGR